MKASNKVNDFCECTAYMSCQQPNGIFTNSKGSKTLSLFAFEKGLTTAQLGFASPSIAKCNIDEFDLQNLTIKDQNFQPNTTDTHLKSSNGENL